MTKNREIWFDSQQKYEQKQMCFKVMRNSRWGDSCKMVKENLTKKDADELAIELNIKEPDTMSVTYFSKKMEN